MVTAVAASDQTVVALGPRRYKVEITVDQETHDKLRSLQDLLGRSATGRDPAAIISRAIDVLLVQTLTRKAAQTSRPRFATDTTATDTTATDKPSAGRPSADKLATGRPETGGPSTGKPATDRPATGAGRESRHISAAVRREVWRRDCGRCCYSDGRGRRCDETRDVEFHHRFPFARGGLHEAANIELRCRAHNQYQADLDFGRVFMDGRRAGSAVARTFPGECAATGLESSSGASGP